MRSTYFFTIPFFFFLKYASFSIITSIIAFLFLHRSDSIQFHSCIRFSFSLFLQFFFKFLFDLVMLCLSSFIRNTQMLCFFLNPNCCFCLCWSCCLVVTIVVPWCVCVLGCIRHCRIHSLNIVFLLNFIIFYMYFIFQRTLLGFSESISCICASTLLFMLGNFRVVDCRSQKIIVCLDSAMLSIALPYPLFDNILY